MHLPRPRTIRARVTLSTCAVLFVALVGAAALIDEDVRQQAFAALDDRLLAEAEALATLVRFDGQEVELEFEDETMGAFAHAGTGAYFQVFTPAGALERSRSLAGAVLPDPRRAPFESLGWAEPRQTDVTTVAGPRGGDVRLLTLYALRYRDGPLDDDEPTPQSERIPVAVQVARSTAEVGVVVSEMRHAMLIGMPLSFLLASLAAFYVSSRATRPIRRMSDAAEEIAAGAHAQRLDSATVDGELEILALTLNRAFDRLNDAVERERRFASELAHELRTPVTIARTRLDVALSRERTGAEYRAALETTRNAVERIEKLVESLLLLARAETVGLERRPVDLVQVVRDAVADLSPEAAQRGLEIGFARAAQSVTIPGNETLLHRLVCNLVENALIHGGAAPGPSISIEDSESEAVLRVSDCGDGFGPEFLPRMFERLARADPSRARATGGAGLGLAIVRAVVQAHGGTIRAANRGSGGAEVEVRLPR